MADNGCNVHFEISPEYTRIFLQNRPHTDSERPHITGKLVLSLAQQTKVSAVRLKVTGTVQRQWGILVMDQCLSNDYTGSVIFEISHNVANPGIFRTLILGPGRHEFPFHIALDLSDRMRETVEGVEGYSISYQLVGEVSRRYAPDLRRFEPLKMYRMPPLFDTEQDLMIPESFDNEWPDKLQYSLTIPNRFVPFGSIISPRLNLTPLTEGLQLASVGFEVMQYHAITLDSFYAQRAGNNITRSKAICEKVFSCSKDMEASPCEESEGIGNLSFNISLPTSLSACTQDMRSSQFQISHKLFFTIRLRNASDYISMIRAALPTVIYMPMCGVDQLKPSQLCARHIIPPIYGRHEEDAIVTDDDVNSTSTNVRPNGLRSLSDPNITTQRDIE